MIGHLLGAAGGVESAVCVKTLVEGIVHPTLNLDDTEDGVIRLSLVHYNNIEEVKKLINCLKDFT